VGQKKKRLDERGGDVVIYYSLGGTKGEVGEKGDGAQLRGGGQQAQTGVHRFKGIGRTSHIFPSVEGTFRKRRVYRTKKEVATKAEGNTRPLLKNPEGAPG